MMTAKQKLTALVLTLIVVISGSVSAHDIDIYYRTANNTSIPAPLVVFTFDIRPNTGSTTCTSGGGSTDPCNFLRTSNVVNGATVGPYLPATGSVSQNALIGAVLRYVLDRTSNINVALMASHNQSSCSNNSCAGPRPASPTTAQKQSNGGFMLAGFQPVNNRSGFDSKLLSVISLSDSLNSSAAHPYQGREMYFEFFRYLTGQGVYNGHNGWTDLGSDTTTNMNQCTTQTVKGVTSTVCDTAYPIQWDATIENGAADPNAIYTTPLAASCSRIYVVNFMAGNASSNEDDSNAAMALAKTSGGIGFDIDAKTMPDGSTNKYYTNYPTDHFARTLAWMYNTDFGDGTWGTVPNLTGNQNITSYFVTAQNNTTTQLYASAGVGQTSGVSPYVLNGDAQKLANQLTDILNQILSVSTSFTSPSVAVNVYNRSQVLNDVYIAMFQADPNGAPLWNGNIKKLQLSNLDLLDATGATAVAGDGRIKYSALTFWTDPNTLPPPDTSIGEIAGKDGRSVARGGCGQRIPSFVSNAAPNTVAEPTNPSGNTTLATSRKLFTEPATYTNGSPTALMPLEATTATANALFSPVNYFGSSTSAAGSCDPTTDTDKTSACNLIKWARGYDETYYSTKGGYTVVTQKSWLVSDPLHSKPLAINYGAINGHSTSNPDVRVIVGSNEGFLRMIRNTAADGTQEGIEAWAFMPHEVMPIINTLRLNSPTSPFTHTIGVDGTPSVYVYDANLDGNIDPTTDKVYVFFGMRRGGSSYYALDVTNPDNPKFLWKISKGAAGTDFAEFGQTWSAPRPAKMITDGTNAIPVLIFAGGYDPNKDTHPPHVSTRTVGSNDSQGNAIFIVNLQTGALIWKAVYGSSAGYNASKKAYTHSGLVDSIPSDVTLVDSDNNGLVDRLYVGDTGGVLWRADLKCSVPSGVHVDASGNPTPGCGTSSAPTPWSIVPLLSVGRHYSNTLADDRRFFYPPDYVQTLDANGVPYDAIPIGTGDREDPYNTDTINYFYMFKDKDTTTGTLTNYNTNGTIAHNQMDDITNCTPATPCSPFPALTYGWRLKLECPATSFALPCGEKNLSSSLTVGGTIYFTTYIPNDSSSTTSCQLSEGVGTYYAVTLQDGQPTDPTNSGGTMDKMDRIGKLASGGIPAEMVQVGNGNALIGLQGISTNMPPGVKTYWNKRVTK